MKIDLFLQGFHLPDVLIGTPSCFISLNLIVFTFRFHLEVLWEILPENAGLADKSTPLGYIERLYFVCFYYLLVIVERAHS